MGFEIPLDIDYVDHPKALRMIALIGKNADIYPIRLWCWCARFAKRGVIEGGSRQIEEACRWTGKPGQLHSALIEAGILKKDGKTIHDWMEHAGSWIAKYEQKKKKQRAKYAGNLPEECRKNSSRGGETERNSSTKNNLNNLEQPNREEPIEPAIALAQKFAFLRNQGTSPSEIARAHVHIADLLAVGIAPEVIDTELERKGRMRSEPVWDFQSRMFEAHGIERGVKNGAGNSVGQPNRVGVDPAKISAIEAKTIRIGAAETSARTEAVADVERRAQPG